MDDQPAIVLLSTRFYLSRSPHPTVAIAIACLPHVHFEELKCACIKLFVKGNAIESVCIGTDLGRSIF